MNDQPNNLIHESDVRVKLAAERTMLAWLRTSLTLMAFGFVVARFSVILKTLNSDTADSFSFQATLIGIGLVVLGVIVNVISAIHYRTYFRKITAVGDALATNMFSVWVALALSVIGIAIAVYLTLSIQI